MKKLYEKNELTFALVWIGVYVALGSAAYPLSEKWGLEYSASALFMVILTALSLGWILKNGLAERYGLCRPKVSARGMLWYVPLMVIASENLWNGAAVNFSLAAGAAYILTMACVGFVEEVIFRGFLYRAMEKDGERAAVIVTSVTFGLGHIVRLVNGSGSTTFDTALQVVLAILIGFLFVTLFRKTGSLIPCILTHSAVDVASAFANGAGMTTPRRMTMWAVDLAVILFYTVYLIKKFPPEQAGGEQRF